MKRVILFDEEDWKFVNIDEGYDPKDVYTTVGIELCGIGDELCKEIDPFCFEFINFCPGAAIKFTDKCPMLSTEFVINTPK